MANYYRNPTASAAIGAVDKEINRARKHGKRLKALQAQGRLTPEALEEAKRRYTGLCRRVLENALR